VKFESLKAGAATMRFGGDAFEPRTLEVSLQAGAPLILSFTPHKGAKLVLRAGQAIKAPQVTVKDSAGRVVKISDTLLKDARALAVGKLQIGPLPAGSYRATVQTDEKSFEYEFTLARGQELEQPWPKQRD
jgi:hypothetical protein